MDAQKISEAASLMKKAALADEWLQRVDKGTPTEDVLARTLVVNTSGDYTMTNGHGEACSYLKRAFDQFKQQVLDTAIELAATDALMAQKTIREEANADR